jgi:hypothetical protein
MTRSFVALISGDVAAAFAWHPLGPVVFVLCAVMPLVAIVSLARGRRLALVDAAISSSRFWLGAGTLTALVWIRQIATLR